MVAMHVLHRFRDTSRHWFEISFTYPHMRECMVYYLAANSWINTITLHM